MLYALRHSHANVMRTALAVWKSVTWRSPRHLPSIIINGSATNSAITAATATTTTTATGTTPSVVQPIPHRVRSNSSGSSEQLNNDEQESKRNILCKYTSTLIYLYSIINNSY
jgi:hypothetical protein